MKNTYKRNGDHYLVPVNSIPDGLEEVKHDNVFTFGTGEASNHNHNLYTKTKESVKIFKDKNGDYWFDLREDAEIRHVEGDSTKTADHEPLVIKKGMYKQNHEREVDIFSQVTRKVID